VSFAQRYSKSVTFGFELPALRSEAVILPLDHKCDKFSPIYCRLVSVNFQ